MSVTIRFLTLACVAALGACATVDSSDPVASDRGPLGKADNIGSCQDDETDFCGGPSDGTCWCDDACELFGDCCGDKTAVCEGDGIEPGGLCLGDSHCDDDQACDDTECLSNCSPNPDFACPAVCWGQCVDTVDPDPDPDPVLPCSDGSVALCEIVPPVCPAGLVISIENNCFGPCVDPATCEPPPSELTCEDIVDAYQTETAMIQACTQDTDCGQVLAGTSCGCTRNWVARTDADLTEWEALRDQAFEQECGIGGISICDCPFADGFVCDGGVCGWNYL